MLVNCGICSRAYNQVGAEKLCGACRETYQRLFQFITEHPDAGLEEIERELGLCAREVREFARHGRFVAFQSLNRQILKCIRCGTPAEHGELCQACFESLIVELDETVRPADKPESSGAGSSRS